MMEMDNDSLPRAKNCPTTLVLGLENGIFRKIKVEWSHYFKDADLFHKEWPYAKIHEQNIKFLYDTDTGSACVYSLNIRDTTVAIGELFNISVNGATAEYDKRVEELKHLQAIYGTIDKGGVGLPGGGLWNNKPYQVKWIIRKVLESTPEFTPDSEELEAIEILRNLRGPVEIP
ncbi:hypothetical protein FRC03_004367 [Tulasnella sp. 419]|nr:hypothetical protein FRC03_004367 [Tulasnella sp. 419]